MLIRGISAKHWCKILTPVVAYASNSWKIQLFSKKINVVLILRKRVPEEMVTYILEPYLLLAGKPLREFPKRCLSYLTSFVTFFTKGYFLMRGVVYWNASKEFPWDILEYILERLTVCFQKKGVWSYRLNGYSLKEQFSVFEKKKFLMRRTGA